MPKMKMSRTLRDGPNGNALDSDANTDERVAILETKDSWTKIRLLDVPSKPVGWVSSDAVDTSEVGDAGAPLDKRAFSRECWRQALPLEINAHYLAGVAELRSGVKNDSVGDETGPYRFTQAEWNDHRTGKDYNFDPEDIGNWRFQCFVFSLLVKDVTDALKKGLKRDATVAEMYLGQLIGAGPSTAVINDAKSPIEPKLGAGGAAIMTRYAAFLKDSAGASVTGEVTLKSIATELTKALDSVKSFYVQAGLEVLDNPDADNDVITDPEKPPNKVSKTAASGKFSDMAPVIMKKLIADFSFEDFQAAGILGNLGEESGGFKQLQEINPIGGGIGGLGWAQWTGSRRTLFENFLAKQGLQPSSFEGNYGFLRLELNTTQTSARDAVKAASDISQAVRVFEANFEKANSKFVRFDVRDSFADQALTAFGKV